VPPEPVSGSSSGLVPPQQACGSSSGFAPPEQASGSGSGLAPCEPASGSGSVPAPPEPAPAVPKPHGKRELVQETWGPFGLSPLTRIVRGERVVFGWGATCRKHHNVGDKLGTQCKKQISQGQGADALSDDECKRLAKCWLLLGRDISDDGPRAREVHLKVKPKLDAPSSWTHEVLDRLVNE
jgi:hypothetical protein